MLVCTTAGGVAGVVGGITGVVIVQSSAEGEAVHPELRAEPWARLGDLLADQGEFPPEPVVDQLEGGTPRCRVRLRGTRDHLEGDHRDDARRPGLVIGPPGVGIDRAVEGAVALKQEVSHDLSPTEKLEAMQWSKAGTAAHAAPSKAERRAEAKAKGYEGEMCSECGNFTLVRNGTCMKCDTCGSTTGCS